MGSPDGRDPWDGNFFLSFSGIYFGILSEILGRNKEAWGKAGHGGQRMPENDRESPRGVFKYISRFGVCLQKGAGHVYPPSCTQLILTGLVDGSSMPNSLQKFNTTRLPKGSGYA